MSRERYVYVLRVAQEFQDLKESEPYTNLTYDFGETLSGALDTLVFEYLGVYSDTWSYERIIQYCQIKIGELDNDPRE